ncbi:MAG: DUF4132 domain-containing protein [Verrucomicrobiota bacterium]|nr:DUF4132 domain-containing protein [Verrucomicrobiota bacterium]
MLTWLKSNLTGGKPFENKAGLPEPMVELLAHDFEQLEQSWPGLPERVLRYVLDDDSPAVLGELAANDGCGVALGLTSSKADYYKPVVKPRTLFFQQVESDDAALFLRLAKVYDAASRQPRQYLFGVFGSGLEWLEAFLWEASNLPKSSSATDGQSCRSVTAALLEQMLALDEKPTDLIVKAVFAGRASYWVTLRLIRWIAGLDERIVRHRAVVDAALASPDFQQRIETLTLLNELSAQIEPFADAIAALAVSSSKLVRQAAAPLVRKASAMMVPLIEAKLESGTPDERAAAARLLWKLEGESRRGFLEARLAAEKTKRVADGLRELLAANAAGFEDALAVSPLPPVEINAPLGEETLAAWRAAFAEINKGLARLAKSPPRYHIQGKLEPVNAQLIDEAFQRLQAPLPENVATLPPQLLGITWETEAKALIAFWRRPELRPIHLLRFGILMDSLSSCNGTWPIFREWFNWCLEQFHDTHPGTGMREVAAAFSAVGLSPETPGRVQLSRFSQSVFAWPAEEVWPYWAEHLDLLAEYLQPDSEDVLLSDVDANALDVIALFPQLPARFLPVLWQLALGAGRAHWAAAQRCLERVPDKLERVIDALRSGNAESRAAAADWLRRLREITAVNALLSALRKEKNDATKSALMFALEQLGVPVEQFLDRQGLRAEAEKGLAKGAPPALAWFPFEALPPVHWADSGARLEPEIVRWWLAQSCKLKNPEPSPLLRRYCASVRPGERETLGQFILEAWIAADTAGVTPDPSGLHRSKISAIDSKGVLAVAAACAGAGAAPVVQHYLKQWYGMRTSQCRALLQMLAWVDHPAATQVLLATGSRFRTKGIQEEANKQAHALAERKGWTLEELSDRTIPTAGLNEDGILELDFGPRQFTARLNEKLDLALFDPDGKPLKTLPDPRRDDDEAKAAEAKMQLGAAKKELKGALTMQRERLYEAMCVQRTWRGEDWELYLNRHPVLRHYTPRLVWPATREDGPPFFFRPLPDGSLTDTNDQAVSINPDAGVRIAHQSLTTPDAACAWQTHLADYEVEPLFEQFGKPVFELKDEHRGDTEISDFRGYLLEAIKLRGRATKLGYTRGQAHDGGWFYEYAKRFPVLGIEAVIEFSGYVVGDENRSVALLTLSFSRIAPQRADGIGARVQLGKIPAVLLSESWNDLRLLASEGPGFDPEWEKNTGR